MKYKIISEQVPRERRAEINDKILMDIDTGKSTLPGEIIYNFYTGIGGLHDLKQSDFPNYLEYSKAKKAFEMGQFFTPHDLCRQMIDIASPATDDMVLDMCCGSGNFFNHLPNIFNAYGFDIDENAVKVAKHLYPDATIEKMDLKRYNPEQRFDIIVGNPPFNLDFGGIQSQYYYCNKAYDLLNPSGLLLMIVPCSFLQSDFWDKKHVRRMENHFSFLGQTKLDPNAFAYLGVKNFETKLVAFLRESVNIVMNPYSADTFITFEEMKKKIVEAKGIKQENKLKIHRETSELTLSEEQRFEYKVKKYLYELKAHKRLQKHYQKAASLVSKYRNQKPPTDCTDAELKEWERSKLTINKVLSVLKRYIQNQEIDPSKKDVISRTKNKEVCLVRSKYEYKLKGYAPRLLDNVPVKSVKIYNLVANDYELPQAPVMTPKLRKQYEQAEKEIARRKRRYIKDNVPFDKMERDPELDGHIKKLSFIDPRSRSKIKFNKLQKHDMGLLYQKRYPLMNWQQGSGKTSVAYNYARYIMALNRVKATIVLAPPIAINMTWEPFMIANNADYLKIESIEDFQYIYEDMYILIPNTMLAKYERFIKKQLRLWSQKACLIFDESDEITNPTTSRTKLTLSCFRRLKYKMLATGTTTRNYVGELYSQFELLYNNSVNMICYCPTRYSQDDDGYIEEYSNEYYLKPFPPRYGATIFKSCFSPHKTTVFGIEKHNQDIYNKTPLAELVAKTIITRKFREFAGDKFSLETHTVKPLKGEIAVQESVFRDFNELCKLFFSDIKDERKKAHLKIRRQIELLIKSCSVPQKFPQYTGDIYPAKAKYIGKLVKNTPDKVAIGCTNLEALDVYVEYIEKIFPFRPVFRIDGSVPFDRRQRILDMFESTKDGILVATQQSLKSSVNIPSCNTVILESLQWNVPRMEQFYFRFIRLNSTGHTKVHYVTYGESIEQNILALVLTKERINEFIKSGEVKEESEIFDEFGITMADIENLLRKNYDSEGKVYFTWGSMKVAG